jgi:two-component system cell cycle response regulator
METVILVIEDDQASLGLMGYLLQAFGYTPVNASSGEEGLEAARRAVPDLILCDIQLPGIDGYEVARQLKRDPVLAEVPLVAVTALAMVGDRSKVMASGFDGYLSKPVVPETFVKQVEGFLPPMRRTGAPAAAADQAATPAATPRPRRPATKDTILAVDDVQSNLLLLASVLEPHGYIVIATDNLKDAMKYMYIYSPTLIISDVHLKDESGYDYLRRVKSNPRFRPIPFIFMSSTATATAEQALAFELGADRFLLRPIEPAALLAEIEAVLSEHRGGNEA